jgi:hypothetical protein
MRMWIYGYSINRAGSKALVYFLCFTSLWSLSASNYSPVVALPHVARAAWQTSKDSCNCSFCSNLFSARIA